MYLIFFIGMLMIMVIFCSVMHYVIDWYPGVEGEFHVYRYGADVFLQLGCKLLKQYKLICSSTLGDPWYLQDHDANDIDIFGILQTTAAYVVLFNYIIPISLYVTIGK